MSYFSHFPIVGYGIDSTAGKIITAKNIILRAKFSDYAKKHSSNMVSYKIKDEDRPDTIAYKLYGQSSLHWVVLLFADIMNPYYQWPLKQNELEIILSKKYNSTTLYIDPDITNAKAKHNLQVPFLEKGDTVEQTSTITGQVITTGKVEYYEPSLTKLVIEGVTGEGFTKNKCKPGDATTTNQITTTNKSGDTLYLVANKVEPTLYSIHHMQDEEGNWIDPTVKPVQGSSLSRIEYFTKSDEESILSALAIKTVQDWEYEENEKKRQISLLKPVFLKENLKQSSKLFRNKLGI